MLRFILIRPGATDFDEQGRIKGSLDIPLSENGTNQVAQTAGELTNVEIDYIYTSPTEAARETAKALAQGRGTKVKELDGLTNLNHGLWHGKLIQEVKEKQPKVYRQWQDHPETICPPGGETLDVAQQRVITQVIKLMKKHKTGVVALVTAEPLASLVRSFLSSKALGDLWKTECDTGTWELIDIEPENLVQR